MTVISPFTNSLNCELCELQNSLSFVGGKPVNLCVISCEITNWCETWFFELFKITLEPFQKPQYLSLRHWKTNKFFWLFFKKCKIWSHCNRRLTRSSWWNTSLLGGRSSVRSFAAAVTTTSNFLHFSLLRKRNLGLCPPSHRSSSFYSQTFCGFLVNITGAFSADYTRLQQRFQKCKFILIFQNLNFLWLLCTIKVDWDEFYLHIQPWNAYL